MNMPETTAISEYLKAFRSEKNLNQTEFAKEIGFSRAELSLIERELVDPRLKTLKKIADYMGISISKLLQVETDGTETYSELHSSENFPELEFISQRLNAFRDKHQESQDVFAEHVGIHIASLSLMERKRMNPRLSTLQKIAAYMGITVSELLTPLQETQDSDNEAGTKRIIISSSRKTMIDFPAIFYHLSIKFLPFYSYANTKTLYTITETLILSRKLPATFRDNIGSFRVCI